MSTKAVRALYRLFLRQARSLERQGLEALDIRMPVNKEAWLFQGGSHAWSPPRDEFRLNSLKSLVPWAAQGVTSGSLSPADLRQLISRAFRQPPAGSSREEQLDRAFQSLRLLSDQIHMQAQGVHVEVTTAYVGRQSDLDPTYEKEEGVADKHYFTYRIRVSNCGEETVQLLGRHWIIQDASGKVLTEVAKGSRGVVGCTPLLEPGACFEYYSGTDLDQPCGSMRGSFQMAVVNQRKPQDKWVRTFDALVAPFAFVRPRNGDGG
ncbi:hypothetical protein CHLNCDRAFT_139531 [Chlorella variabilis]|uniref:ApaG domain-containing protein n=1 Tax=Chlorella variabilis TaxID=554065 RepID=E1ZQC5_CHLVA|nr:hypothetical protein CHLNCDRAFT_139531 [Chlorella variabilis]EFN52001.1 hypothetical protein CHLNCDRAFT_139531 [Chlorella variabilis]|eukprot:XP_005844103.1 hypothetical protein CHLNCDRAFT_139531 [Chlorella variabilis]